jgi:hypothetical protein
LYPGEKVFVEVEEYDGTIKHDNCKGKKTLEYFGKILKAIKDKHQNMVLQIDNPFIMDLSYSANILLMKTKMGKTKCCPWKPGFY